MISLIFAISAFVQGISAELKLEANSLEIREGSQLAVSIAVENVVNLHSFQLGIAFDPRILRVTSVIEGSFLNQDVIDPTQWMTPVIDHLNGKISNIRCSRLKSQGIQGSGQLVIIYFSAQGSGTAFIDFLKPECHLRDALNQDIGIKDYTSLQIDAIGDPQAELSIPATHGILNQIIEVPVYISNVVDFSIISALISLAADEKVLVPLDVRIANTLTETWQQPTFNIQGGTLLFALAGFTPLSQDGVLVNVRYRVHPLAHEGDTTAISFSSVMLNEGDPGAITRHGSFRAESLQLSGGISYAGTRIPIPRVTVALSGEFPESRQTDYDGNFSFTEVRYGEYDLIPSKQGDPGNSITPFDAALILQHIVHLTRLSPYQSIAANTSGDSTVSALDASNVLRYSVGLIDRFPIMKDDGDFWRFLPLSSILTDADWFKASSSLHYAPLAEDRYKQNFLGIVYGDVSQNWQPTMLNKNLPRSATVANLSFGPGRETSPSIVQIPILFDCEIEVAALQLDIRFDARELKFISLEKGQSIDGFLVVHHVIDDIIKIALAGANPTMVHGELMCLNFLVAHDEYASCEFVNAILNEDQFIAVEEQPMENGDDLLPQRFALDQNYPNPFNHETVIRFSVPESRHVRLAIFDLTGRCIMTLMDERMEAGNYSVKWYGVDAQHQLVSSGTYLMVLSSESEREVRKVVFLK